MRSLGSIFCISIYLIFTTQIRQLIKLPLLIEHYIEHKRIQPNISFWQFLDMHYAHDDVQNADYESDMKLPFKTIETSFNISFVLIPQDILSFKKGILSERSSCFNGCSPHWKSNLLSSVIWQPPKFS
ncbi:MAG: hypothetical protein ABI844_02245 [Saprospiraceae bacterium]